MIKKVLRIICAIGRRIKWGSLTALMYILRVFPIKKDKVVFVNYYGKGYGDNAKYICEELIKNQYDLDIVWALKNLNDPLPAEIRKVKYNSLKFFYELCTAKVWVDNCRKYLYIRKRKGQYYIQVWHADFGIKKAGADAPGSLYKSYIKGAKNDSKMADLFICGNERAIGLFKRACWYDGEILKCGYPRRDILYTASGEQINSFKIKAGFSPEDRIAFYAPTFRKDASLDVYSIDWDRFLPELEKRFGGKWKGMIRLHPNISYLSDKLITNEKVINATNYDDMQELLALSDICITDYSSSAMEFAVTGKPAFVFATDYAEYKKDRDVYFEFSEMPYPFAESNDELIENIRNFDAEKYNTDYKHFYKDVLGMFEDGTASKTIAELIFEKCNSSISK